MNFEIKKNLSFISGVVKGLASRGMKKEAVGMARSIFRRGLNTPRRGPVRPAAMPDSEPALANMEPAGGGFKDLFWKDGKPTGLTSHTASIGTLGALGAGGKGLYDAGHGMGRLDGARETMDTAVSSISDMDKMRQIEFFMGLLGKDEAEMAEYFKQLIPEDKRQYFA